MIYVSIVRKSLQGLPVNNLTHRRVLYEQLRAGLKSALDDAEPPLDVHATAIEIRLLEITIRRFEIDLRSGVDVTADDYVPQGVAEEQERLYARRALIAARARPPAASVVTGTVTPANVDEGFAASLLPLLEGLSFGAKPESDRRALLRFATLRAVLLRIVREMADSQGRLGLLWIVIEPMLLIVLMLSLYIMTGERSVMNMDIVPFAITGIVTWLMIRVTIVRVNTSIQSKDLLSLPPIRIGSLAIGHAMVQYLIYAQVFLGAALIAYIAGEKVYPENWVECILIWTSLWFIGLLMGLVFSLTSSLVPLSTRFMMIFLRMIGWVSAIFFVSEQFPTEFKGYILWNPLLHGFQLLRSAYFVGYESADASVSYYLSSIGILIVIAAACERTLRPRVEPA